MKNDRGPYIRTYTGRKFYPLDPRPEDFSLVDIVHQLMRVPRWGGCNGLHYSVLHHSYWCATRDGLTDNERAALFFHDASEAYICDLPKPIKCAVQGYKPIENAIMASVANRFMVEFPLSERCHEVDCLALVTERIALFHPDHWFLAEDYPGESRLFVSAGDLAYTVKDLLQTKEDDLLRMVWDLMDRLEISA